MMLAQEQLEKIKDFAIDLDWNSAFEGKSKGNRHLFRIVQKARDLAKHRDADITDLDIRIIEAGAWLHDTNLEQTISGSTLANKNKVLKFLEEIRVSKTDAERILHCIEAHDGRILAETTEAKIVHDADTLEKMGPLGIIRETWKRSQEGWNTEKIIKHLKSHLRKREAKLYTQKAKITAKRLNDDLIHFFKTVNEQIRE